MQQPPLPVPGPLALLDTTEGFVRRKKISLWFVGSLLVLSVFILTIGLAATTRTENVTVGGYYPGIILGFGSFLGIIGINLVENRRQMLVAAIVFISFGVVAAFCCAIVDGVFAARHLETRPLTLGRCQFYSSGVGYLHDVYQTEVTCHSLNGKCQLKVKSNTCYCCDLYNCQRSLCPSWPTGRLRHLRSSTTLLITSWPTRALAQHPQPSPPARPTLCRSSRPAASQPRPPRTSLCPRTHSLRPSPAPASGFRPTPHLSMPQLLSSRGKSLLPTHHDTERINLKINFFYLLKKQSSVYKTCFCGQPPRDIRRMFQKSVSSFPPWAHP
ncbi:transmembrane protein 255B isoform X2 [Rhinolophus ferrumequinum]|uniref:transmembrane protein 255B isoform X2 n=1 Tax=Rhinolophus ferrumequinum TaxID=59479 RepID=UPI00140F91A5|nr:transmembrane protein 255B isoform X2 [Rhinolophus ferrumequinum]